MEPFNGTTTQCQIEEIVGEDGATTTKEVCETVQTDVGKIMVFVNPHWLGTKRPTGITLYDEDTGQPYCLKIKSGEIIKVAGECSFAQ